jgi:hypothetical protein
MNDTAPPSSKPHSGWDEAVKTMAVLFVIWLIIEVIGIQVLGRNNNTTFQHVSSPTTTAPTAVQGSTHE